MLQLQCHSPTAQLLQTRKTSFQLLFAKLRFEALILFCGKKWPLGYRTADFLPFKKWADKGAQVSNIPKSAPKSSVADHPTADLYLCWDPSWRCGGNTTQGWLSVGGPVALHQQELASGTQWILGSNSGIPNQKRPLPGELSASYFLGYT